ncbi:UNVERIFIED_CONTAM: hypothetical protein Sradi_5412600 [Sesamum radiatum]|uniref:Uncharacterized protein n=1 Tax=Sesamum radiatum TaxID=300843 RepID=A0AAW2L8B8_SESRA
MARKVFEDRFVAEQTNEIINLEHALADAEMKLSKKFLVMSIVDNFPSPGKISAEYQPRANLIVGKQKVSKVNLN